jgi:TolA-binding protein
MKLPAALLAATFLCAAPAHAQMETREGIALQNQIAELRQELQYLQQSRQDAGQPPSSLAPPQSQYEPQPPPQAGGPAPGGDTAAELTVRVSALEEQNRTLQGRVDDLANQLQHQHDDLAKQISDLAFKLGQGPAAAPPPSAGGGEDTLQPPSEPSFHQPPPPPPPAHRTPEMALREGNAAMARHDYAAAAAAARDAMAGHGPRGTDAQLLLARAEGAQRQYKESAADFYQAYNHAPRAGTAPIALLGVANALIAMNDGRDACQALAKLSAEFPTSNKPGVLSARKRAGCGK